MFAVIKTGGKQYIVEQGKLIKIEKLPQEEGSEVVFEEVLLVSNDGKTQIGTPAVVGAAVKGVIVRHARAKKVMAIKAKAKKRYRKKLGHKQPFTEVKITGIAA